MQMTRYLSIESNKGYEQRNIFLASVQAPFFFRQSKSRYNNRLFRIMPMSFFSLQKKIEKILSWGEGQNYKEFCKTNLL